MFALSPWDRPMQYGQQAADEMKAKETLFRNFFQNVEVVMRQHKTVKHRSKWDVSLVTGYLLAHPNGPRQLLHDTRCLLSCWHQLDLGLPTAATRSHSFRCQHALYCDSSKMVIISDLAGFNMYCL
jgi:hypothetical protein